MTPKHTALAPVALLAALLAVAPTARAQSRDLVVFVGDSFTLGYTGAGDPGDLSPTPYRALRFPRHVGATYMLIARKGAGTCAMTRAVGSLVRTRGKSLAVAIIAAGLNDALMTDTISNIQKMARLVKDAGATPVLVAIPPVGHSDLSKGQKVRAEEVNQAIKALSYAVFVNSHEVLSTDPSTFGGGIKREFLGKRTSVHPNKLGYEALTAQIAAAVNSVLDSSLGRDVARAGP